MKYPSKLFAFLFLILISVSCTETEEPNDDLLNAKVFRVPFEGIIPLLANNDGTFNISNARFEAGFPERANVNGYEIKIVKEDGTFGSTNVRRANQLEKRGDKLFFVVMIGTPYAGIGVSSTVKDQMFQTFQTQLQNAKPNYKAIEVTVLEN
ncbi:hypothetical protein [Algoriphagus sp.]|uniref:hypothetical protein n=1 Tax=Algoriphagus sp. TaxID=1872435 RepID=UPI003919BE57